MAILGAAALSNCSDPSHKPSTPSAERSPDDSIARGVDSHTNEDVNATDALSSTNNQPYVAPVPNCTDDGAALFRNRQVPGPRNPWNITSGPGSIVFISATGSNIAAYDWMAGKVTWERQVPTLKKAAFSAVTLSSAGVPGRLLAVPFKGRIVEMDFAGNVVRSMPFHRGRCKKPAAHGDLVAVYGSPWGGTDEVWLYDFNGEPAVYTGADLTKAGVTGSITACPDFDSKGSLWIPFRSSSASLLGTTVGLCRVAGGALDCPANIVDPSFITISRYHGAVLRDDAFVFFGIAPRWYNPSGDGHYSDTMAAAAIVGLKEPRLLGWFGLPKHIQVVRPAKRGGVAESISVWSSTVWHGTVFAVVDAGGQRRGPSDLPDVLEGTGIRDVAASGDAWLLLEHDYRDGAPWAMLHRVDNWGRSACETSGVCALGGSAKCASSDSCQETLCVKDGACEYRHAPDGTTCGVRRVCAAGLCQAATGTTP